MGRGSANAEPAGEQDEQDDEPTADLDLEADEDVSSSSSFNSNSNSDEQELALQADERLDPIEDEDEDEDDEEDVEPADDADEADDEELLSDGQIEAAGSDIGGRKTGNIYTAARRRPVSTRPAQWQRQPQHLEQQQHQQQQQQQQQQPLLFSGPIELKPAISNASIQTGSGLGQTRRGKFKRLRQRLKLAGKAAAAAPIGRKRASSRRGGGGVASNVLGAGSGSGPRFNSVSGPGSGSGSGPKSGQVGGQVVAPKLERRYNGRVRENERLVEMAPRLKSLSAAEVCDIELLPINKTLFIGDQSDDMSLPFVVSWIDRINGEASIEAKREDLMNCERQRNYTFKMRAIGCNGLASNE